MKNIIRIFSLGAALACLLVTGCSKSNDNASANAATGTNGQAGANGPVEMKIKWAPGKQYVQEMSLKQNSELTMPGAPKPMMQQTEITQGFSLSALKTPSAGAAELELKFLSQKISSKMDGREVMSFDSNDDPALDNANEIRQGLRKAIGAHINYVLDSNGNLANMVNYQEFIDQLTSGTTGPAQMMLKSMFNEWSMKEFGSHTRILPNKPVKIGDTWDSEYENTSGSFGTLKILLKFKFAKWEDHLDRHCMLLTYTGQLTSKAAETAGAMSVTIDKGEVKGQTWFDPAEGIVVESTGDQSMTIKMTMQQGEMISKMKQKTEVRLIEISNIAK